jgi:hypothetical protein
VVPIATYPLPEFNSIPKNTPFVSTDHCGTIRILNEFIKTDNVNTTEIKRL